MAGKRTRYSAEFRAHVALEALRGELTTAQLAAQHGIHQTRMRGWKRQAVEGMVVVFSGRSAAQESSPALVPALMPARLSPEVTHSFEE